MISAAALVFVALSAFADRSADMPGHNVIQINNTDVVIVVHAARDTGPVTRMDASGLIVSIEIYSLDRHQLPEKTEIQSAWAFSDSDKWDMNTSKDISRSRYFDGTGVAYKFREGPLWPTGTDLNISFTMLVNETSYSFSLKEIRILKNQ